MCEDFRFDVQLIESRAFVPNPKVSFIIEVECIYQVVSGTICIVGVVDKFLESFGVPIEFVDPTPGCDPQVAVAIFSNIVNAIVADGFRIINVLFVNGDPITIVSIQSVACAEPHETPTVLKNANDIALRKALGAAKMIEFQVAFLSCQQNWQQYEKKSKKASDREVKVA